MKKYKYIDFTCSDDDSARELVQRMSDESWRLIAVCGGFWHRTFYFEKECE